MPGTLIERTGIIFLIFKKEREISSNVCRKRNVALYGKQQFLWSSGTLSFLNKIYNFLQSMKIAVENITNEHHSQLLAIIFPANQLKLIFAWDLFLWMLFFLEIAISTSGDFQFFFSFLYPFLFFPFFSFSYFFSFFLFLLYKWYL